MHGLAHWTAVLTLGPLIAFAGRSLADVTEVDPEQQASQAAEVEGVGTQPAGLVTTFGDQAPVATQPGEDVAASPADGAAEAEAVMQRLLRQRQEMPIIEPGVAGPGMVPDAGGRLPDPAVIGVAPDQPAPPLRREGEFIVSRRGRVFMLSDGRTQFRFEADSERSPEAPVFLLPCQMLEHIEQLVRQRGDELVFVLSGQVFTYHGGNWLLPTMMKIEINRTNLGQ